MTKRYVAELVGTFTIVFAPVAFSAVTADTTESTLLGAALVSGLAVLAMVAAFGAISAAHFNPAVTLAFASAGRFPWKYVAPYIAAQSAGAVLAAMLARLLYSGSFGAHVPTTQDALRNVGTEAVITFFLMSVIMAVATDRRVNAAVPPLAIGMTVVLGVLVGGPVTGGSMNPARSLGPALVARGDSLSSLWIYLVGPIAGALLAARIYEYLRIDHGDATDAPALIRADGSGTEVGQPEN